MEACILAIILTCGFIYTTKSPKCKFTLFRIKDWIQYLYVFAKGLPFAFIAFIFTEAIYCLSERKWISDYSFNVIILWSFISVCIAQVVGWYQSKNESEKNTAILLSAEEDSFKEKIYDAMVNPKFIQVTLTTGKVYVGMILSMTELSKPDIKYLKICPILSGYRDSEKHIIIFTNNYWANYKDTFVKFLSSSNNKNLSADDMLAGFKKNKKHLKDTERLLAQLDKFMTVISLEHIVSISNFNFDIYLKINAHNEETLGSLLIKAAINNGTECR